MTRREKAHAELQHALAALDEAYFYSRVVSTLMDQDPYAFMALDEANKALRALGYAADFVLGMREERKVALRKLAPVLLDIVLDVRRIE